MKYYKIINPDGHNGLVYHEGLNVDPLHFKPYGDCLDGGIYFAREDIFAFLRYGSELYEVEPVGEVYENPCIYSERKKWKAHEVNLKYVGPAWDNIPFLVEQGVNIYADYLLRMAAINGDFKLIKYLVENGANFHAYDDYPLRYAAQNGYTEIVKYLKSLK